MQRTRFGCPAGLAGPGLALLLGGCSAASAAGAGRDSPAQPGPRQAVSPLPGTSSEHLARLPDGETKRRFILDCTGCHQMDDVTVGLGANAKTRFEWEDWTSRMVGMAGNASGFPVISASRDPAATAGWLSAHLTPDSEPERGDEAPPDEGSDWEVTEFDMPVAGDLPHDLMVAADGSVVITGMFSGSMWVLDPMSGAFSEVDLPGGGPRALDIDEAGNWYVVLGTPRMIARRDAGTGEWRTWSVGVYPHSIQLDGQGRVWFNGHFSRAPERIGYVDPAADAVEIFEVPSPAMPDGGRTIQYGLRVDPQGTVWTTQLAGGRLIRFEPGVGEFELFPLPTEFSGPRRPDLDADGDVWIPAYANNELLRFDRETESFEVHALPIADALPYVVRIDRSRGIVWIGTGAADAILRYEIATGEFTVIRLPSRGALIRHLDVDRDTGELWVAYGASPGRIPARIARLRPAGQPARATPH